MSKAKKPYKWVEQAVIISAMRRSFRRYPAYQEVRTRCKSEYFEKCKNGNSRRRVAFRCELCDTKVGNKDFRVDHVLPVVSVTEGFVDYNTYAERLFCGIENLQGLCKPCHDKKSKGENSDRRKAKKEKIK